MYNKILPAVVNLKNKQVIMGSLGKMVSTIRLDLDNLSQDGFRKLFTNVDQVSVKKSVDRQGIDKFIEHCARMAAVSGAISGGGGIFTVAVGIPLDLVNLVTQQIRVTLGIIYYTRGAYEITFDEFLSYMAAALQVEAGIAITKTILERGSEKMLLRMGTKTATRLIPVIGGAIGGTTNYLFIKRMADRVKRLQPQFQPLSVHVEEF
ncbi:hypothetical protein [Mucilaginibacter sp.]|uniref:hypothetical protein n=1 Tax=Mucilaginibacter sp. TaxID=1882438 RepID=UPI002C19B207|nr:hypothetical protein [Mucilaginibacter sp.]HTI58492.1 hypothetical protein [Mucilaginibacter sp.]